MGGSGKAEKKAASGKHLGGSAPCGVSSGAAARVAALSQAPPALAQEAGAESERGASKLAGWERRKRRSGRGAFEAHNSTIGDGMSVEQSAGGDASGRSGGKHRP